MQSCLPAVRYQPIYVNIINYANYRKPVLQLTLSLLICIIDLSICPFNIQLAKMDLSYLSIWRVLFMVVLSEQGTVSALGAQANITAAGRVKVNFFQVTMKIMLFQSMLLASIQLKLSPLHLTLSTTKINFLKLCPLNYMSCQRISINKALCRHHVTFSILSAQEASIIHSSDQFSKLRPFESCILVRRSFNIW